MTSSKLRELLFLLPEDDDSEVIVIVNGDRSKTFEIESVITDKQQLSGQEFLVLKVEKIKVTAKDAAERAWLEAGGIEVDD